MDKYNLNETADKIKIDEIIKLIDNKISVFEATKDLIKNLQNKNVDNDWIVKITWDIIN